MAGFADLVQQAQPALVGGGVYVEATEGRTWEWEFEDVVDSAGDPIDLSAAVGVCEVLTDAGTVVTTLDFTGTAAGTFTVGLDEADTADLTVGNYTWALYVTSGGDSVQFWGRTGSRFAIRKG